MISIPIYKEEKSIATEIQNTRSIAYCSEVEPSKFRDKLLELPDIAKSSYKDKDLYFHQSILVTTNWNKNGDIFIPKEVWIARYTPEDKPTNIEHNESKIVGHMTNNFAIDTDGNLIKNDIAIDELPSQFHILVNAVIYKTWENEEQQKIIANLIEKIESGEMYVSMECILRDFDYMLDNGDEQKIIARNESTAFLTKYLKSYGGTGEYNGQKIGRILRNITFSGKGYTEKPANPESIIFTKNDLFNFSNAKIVNDNNFLEKNGVSLNKTVVSHTNTKKGIKMSDEIYKDQAEKLEKQNQILATELEKLKQELAKADVEKHQKAMAKLEAELESVKSELQARDKSISAAEDKVSDLEKSIVDLEKTKSELEDKIKKVEQENIKAARVAKLIEGGLDKTKAAEKVDLYISLDDKQFKSIAEDIIAAVKKNQTETIVVDADEEETADAADIENTEVEKEASLSVNASDKESDEEETLKALASNFSTRLKYKNKENK